MTKPSKQKKMKFKHHRAGKGGWSEWVFPTEKYLFKCCDCGLVHEMQFKVFAETNRKRGTFEIVELPLPIRAMFRARRWRGTKTPKGRRLSNTH